MNGDHNSSILNRLFEIGSSNEPMSDRGFEENIPKELWTEILLLLIKSDSFPPFLMNEMCRYGGLKFIAWESFAFSALSMPRLVNKKLRDCCRIVVRDTGVDKVDFRFRFAEYACINDYINCLQYYVACNGPLEKGDLPRCAAPLGDINLLKYLLEIGCTFDAATLSFSAISNNVECMQFILEHGGGFGGTDLLGIAARSGALDALKFAHENGDHWYYEVLCDAAKAGNLEIMKYAHEHGCGWTSYVCLDAAQYGHLDCLKYAHEHGCSWLDAETCILAAENGHLDCVKYLHDEGCSWVNNTCHRALKKNQLHVVKYLHENGCPCEHNNKI